MDEGWARAVVEMEMSGRLTPPTGEAGERTFSPLGYSDVISRLDLIADRVLAVRTATQANYTKAHKEPKFDPLPRPTTAIERERERRTRTVLTEADDLLLGGGIVLEAD